LPQFDRAQTREQFRFADLELFARLRVIKMRQLDLLHEATAAGHTAESSSFVIEVGGDEGDLGESRDR
jgi:hypothetical protein